MNYLDEGALRPAVAQHTTASYLSVLGLRPSLGRWFDATEDRAGSAVVAVIGHHAWTSKFRADPSVIGRTIRIEGVPVTITRCWPCKSPQHNQHRHRHRLLAASFVAHGARSASARAGAASGGGGSLRESSSPRWRHRSAGDRHLLRSGGPTHEQQGRQVAACDRQHEPDDNEQEPRDGRQQTVHLPVNTRHIARRERRKALAWILLRVLDASRVPRMEQMPGGVATPRIYGGSDPDRPMTAPISSIWRPPNDRAPSGGSRWPSADENTRRGFGMADSSRGSNPHMIRRSAASTGCRTSVEIR